MVSVVSIRLSEPGSQWDHGNFHLRCSAHIPSKGSFSKKKYICKHYRYCMYSIGLLENVNIMVPKYDFWQLLNRNGFNHWIRIVSWKNWGSKSCETFQKGIYNPGFCSEKASDFTKSMCFSLKRQCHKIFDPWFFSHIMLASLKCP
jgi:hypothetical protein